MGPEPPSTRNYQPCHGAEYDQVVNRPAYAKCRWLRHHLGRPLPTIDPQGTRTRRLRSIWLVDPKRMESLQP